MVVEQKKHPDFILLAAILVLLGWGIFTLGTVSAPLSLENYGNTWHYFFHQILWGLLPGIILGFICFRLPLKFLKKWGPWLFFFNLILLFLVFLPKIGVELGGAKRWLGLGPILFQPSELLKITFILYLASWLANKSGELKKSKKNQALIVFLIILAVLGFGLLSQPDMSTAGIILITALLMYFAAPTPFWHSLLIIIGGSGAAFVLIKIIPYRAARLFTFLHPEIDPLGASFQLKQALIAIGSGKIFGIEQGFGLGWSRQKFGFLPHSMSDSIFAIIGEEMGFIGASVLIFLFLVLLWRGLRIAVRAEKSFFRLLALGITSWLILQTFFNIGGMTGILPLAGIPLPFFSYGGSHLIAELIGVGILLNISKKI